MLGFVLKFGVFFVILSFVLTYTGYMAEGSLTWDSYYDHAGVSRIPSDVLEFLGGLRYTFGPDGLLSDAQDGIQNFMSGLEDTITGTFEAFGKLFSDPVGFFKQLWRDTGLLGDDSSTEAEEASSSPEAAASFVLWEVIV